MSDLKEINIILYVILTIFTFGLFYFYWQYRQMKMCNELLGVSSHGMIKWFFLSFITFGLYHFYHEYKFSQDIILIQERYNLKPHSGEYPLLCLIVSVFGLFLLSDIIHQDSLNKIVVELSNRSI